MKFIKLTQFSSNNALFVNMELIDKMIRVSEDGAPYTRLCRVSHPVSFYAVMETPEEILLMLDPTMRDPFAGVI